MLRVVELKALLRAQGLRLSKRLGQHHLIDAACIERLAASCGLGPGDTVVEIGAGLGALTEPLARRAGWVFAVEVDTRICALLAERMQGVPKVAVVCQDILTFAWDRVPGAVVVGAIPYHITSPILVSLCEHRRFIAAAWLLVQRELAERLGALPGTKAYGRLSLLCQYGWQFTQVAAVSRRAFFPQPLVDSAWVRLLPRKTPAVTVEDEPRVFAVVKAAFSHRRKTLANCLSREGFATRRQVEEYLTKQGLPPSVRGEVLTFGQFAILSSALAKVSSW